MRDEAPVPKVAALALPPQQVRVLPHALRPRESTMNSLLTLVVVVVVIFLLVGLVRR